MAKTTNFNLNKPADQADGWGGTDSDSVNWNFDTIDTQLNKHQLMQFKTASVDATGDTTPTIAAGSVVQMSASSAQDVHGLDGGTDQQIAVIVFDGDITLKHNDAGGGATTFHLPGGSDYTPSDNEVGVFILDGTVWRTVAFTFGGNTGSNYPAFVPSGMLLGNGSDGAGPTAGNTIDFADGKEFTSWTIASGNVTLTTQTGLAAEGYLFAAVQGALTFDATGKLDVSGAGGAGGNGETGDGDDGDDLDIVFAATGGGGGGGVNVGYDGGDGGDTLAQFGGSGGGQQASGAAGSAANHVGPWFYSPIGSGLGPSTGGGEGYGFSSQDETGGAGGPLLVISCGSLNFPSGAEIDASGADGSTPATIYDGGGGGGGGGTVLIITKNVVANAGTITVAGGAGGTGQGSGGDGGAGGDGKYKVLVLA